MPETGERCGRRVKRRSKGYSAESSPPKANISQEEQKAMEELRKDTTRTVLTADNRVALVVMNQEDYDKKAEELLNNLQQDKQ